MDGPVLPEIVELYKRISPSNSSLKNFGGTSRNFVDVTESFSVDGKKMDPRAGQRVSFGRRKGDYTPATRFGGSEVTLEAANCKARNSYPHSTRLIELDLYHV